MDRALPLVATALVGVAHFFAWRAEPVHAWTALPLAYVPMLIASIVYLRREELLREKLRWRAGDISRGIATAAAGLVFTYGVAVLAKKWLPHVVESDLAGVARVAEAIPRETRWVAIVLFAGAEELVWRGALPAAVESKVGTRRASARAPWIASALFVVAVTPSRHPSLIVAAIAVGVGSAFLVARTGRLIPSIIAHFVYTWGVLDVLLPMLQRHSA